MGSARRTGSVGTDHSNVRQAEGSEQAAGESLLGRSGDDDLVTLRPMDAHLLDGVPDRTLG